jgi:DNA mismatch endonuclease (patch repair protein)
MTFDPGSRAHRSQKNLENAEEQDRAAGGREQRMVVRPSGKISLASVQLTLDKSGRTARAVLRYRGAVETVTKSIGAVTASTREAQLKEAWDKAKALGLLGRSAPENRTTGK